MTFDNSTKLFRFIKSQLIHKQKMFNPTLLKFVHLKIDYAFGLGLYRLIFGMGLSGLCVALIDVTIVEH